MKRLLIYFCSSVTGSGSGYGAGIARRFCQEGCKVIIADFNEPNGLRVAEDIGSSAAFFKTDVAKREEWEKLVEFTVGKFGAVDILVNNAGTSYKNKVGSSLYFPLCMMGKCSTLLNVYATANIGRHRGRIRRLLQRQRSVHIPFHPRRRPLHDLLGQGWQRH